ncbi:MAG: hypothetical protein J6Y96_01375 [Mycoplasma sp.]|nr:hypothetical protein [Mycoplasma sp.]
MLEEVKIIDKNYKGTIGLTNELIKKSIFMLAGYDSNFQVKNVELQQIKEMSKTILIIEFVKNNKTQFYGSIVVDYIKKLSLYINLNLNISNLNIVLVFD